MAEYCVLFISCLHSQISCKKKERKKKAFFPLKWLQWHAKSFHSISLLKGNTNEWTDINSLCELPSAGEVEPLCCLMWVAWTNAIFKLLWSEWIFNKWMAFIHMCFSFIYLKLSLLFYFLCSLALLFFPCSTNNNKSLLWDGPIKAHITDEWL